MSFSTKKKKIIILSSAILLAVFFMLAIIPFLLREEEQTPAYPDYDFAEEWLSADIYSDEAYMELDRAIYYKTIDGYELTVPITDDQYIHQSDEVQLLVDFVKAAIAGDEDAYNACFSPEYIAKSGAVAPFTMQKLYNILITDYRTASTVPAGYVSARVYGLRYMIKDNNGSLRRDIGSDAEREQYISVVTDDDGNAYIYGVEIRLT